MEGSKIYLDIDQSKTNQDNSIEEEEITNIYVDILKKLGHDIFFEEGLVIYSDINNKWGTELEKGSDYTLEIHDDESSSISGKDCYRRVKFRNSYSRLYVDYWVYGDIITSGIINDIHERLNVVEDDTIDCGTF
jgi:hypothetical protein